MPWYSNLLSSITGNTNTGFEDLKAKIQAGDKNAVIADTELTAYISDIESRVKKMVKDLKAVYSTYGITFGGFKSFDLACDSLKDSVKNDKEEAYNNLIKLESMVTTEQKRHLALIRIAMTKDGRKVLDLISQDPKAKQIFIKVFGERDVAGKQNLDGLYQQLWSEIHKLSEYIIIKKNKVYH